MNSLEEKVDRILAILERQLLPQEWYTTKEAAKLLEYSPDTIKRYCQTGTIKAELRRMPGRQKKLWYISKQVLEAFKNHRPV